MEKGKINVSTENIFPIIKKFLYSDQDIFLRELISNAVDATTKVQKLALMGEVKGEVGDTTIQVRIDADKKQLIISDKGLGMTGEEVKKYINTIALSSAEEFLEKFKTVDDKASIIGHFGLGFYSAFMVADTVEINTKSYKEEPAVNWVCDGSTDFHLKASDKAERGTDIILHINEESKEFLNEWKIKELLDKYCKFLPVAIQFGTEEYTEKDAEGKEEKKTKDRIINNTQPAWVRSPKDLKDEDYLAFYKELYPFAEPPLFWIHLNTDFPFNLKGVLFFPKFKNTFDFNKNKIHLYCNQVFVTDSVEQIVPEFLTLLQGVIDSPDIPLNVSRSYLQSDSNVKKITAHIVKKVADKLHEIFSNNREEFEQKWESLSVFVKYGIISDEKFYERAKEFCLLENTDKKYFTIQEYQDKISVLQKDKHNFTTALYTTDVEAQDSYIQNVNRQSYDVLNMSTAIDNHFMQYLESKLENFTFKRVDADTVDKLIEKEETATSVLSKEEEEKLKKVFEDTIKTKGATVELKPLSPTDLPVLITKNEFMRRMQEMAKMGGGSPYSFMGDMGETYTVVVNTNHPLANKILQNESNASLTVKQLYDLAMLSQGMLKGKELTEFISRSVSGLN
jgi:molecular chaperone HtpG